MFSGLDVQHRMPRLMVPEASERSGRIQAPLTPARLSKAASDPVLDLNRKDPREGVSFRKVSGLRPLPRIKRNS